MLVMFPDFVQRACLRRPPREHRQGAWAFFHLLQVTILHFCPGALYVRFLVSVSAAPVARA
jgi:hypothetical protein